jgi:hypothetical protein
MKSTGKPYEGKPHVRFDEKALEIEQEGDFASLRQCFTLLFSIGDRRLKKRIEDIRIKDRGSRFEVKGAWN